MEDGRSISPDVEVVGVWSGFFGSWPRHQGSQAVRLRYWTWVGLEKKKRPPVEKGITLLIPEKQILPFDN